mmetsp:Transcript_18153/g.51830  ORF Transcript_18153/g.51830 Transcript_18153/m.51830 type:complete len:232 (+) Transcript_18153:63-758(+)
MVPPASDMDVGAQTASAFSLPWRYGVILAVLTIAGKAGDALGPLWVEDRPLTLLALNSNDLHLSLSVPGTHWLPWYTIGTLRRLSEDPVFFLIGWHYRDAGLEWLKRRSPGSAASLEKASSAFARFSGAAVVIEPGAVVCLLAGAARMRPETFAALNFGGTVARLLLIRAAAAALPQPLEVALQLVRRFSMPLALIASCAVGLSCVSLIRRSPSAADGAASNDDGNRVHER